jgi:hypothetical protein
MLRLVHSLGLLAGAVDAPAKYIRPSWTFEVPGIVKNISADDAELAVIPIGRPQE